MVGSQAGKWILEHKVLTIEVTFLVIFFGWLGLGFVELDRGKHWGQQSGFAELETIARETPRGTSMAEMLNAIGDPPDDQRNHFAAPPGRFSFGKGYIDSVSRTLIYRRDIGGQIYLHYDSRDAYLGYWSGVIK